MSSAQHQSDFYTQGKAYWETIPATVDGMLGGYSEISSIDISSSNRFLNTFLQKKENPLGTRRALDCGSGIGRVTKHLLLPLFDTVDMVEQNQSFLNGAKAYIGQEAHRVRCEYPPVLSTPGLQDFVPEEHKYDVIWCQWVTGHLTDKDFVSFLRRCQAGLHKDGILVIKDNLTQDEVDVDNRDGSVTRPRTLFEQLFEKAGMRIVAERKQYKFPRGLYEVRMFALQ
ncbi:unnamed protein product [Ixodes hexagonus]